MATKLNCANDNSCAIEQKNVDLQAVERSILNDAVLEKEQLQGRLIGATICNERKIEKSQTEVCQLIENNTIPWNEHQNENKDLDKIKNHKVRFNVETDDLIKFIGSYKCSDLNELDKENTFLEENINNLKTYLKEEDKPQKILKSQNQNHIKCSEHKSKEFTSSTQQFVGEIDELNNAEIEEFPELRPILDDFIQEKIIFNFEKLQHILNVDKLLKEIEIGGKYSEDLNQTISQQNCQNQKLTEMLEKCNHKNAVLKQTIEKENIESENFVDKLRKERLNIEEERIDLEKKFKDSEIVLEKLEHQNEQLSAEVNKSQCKLDEAIHNSGEKQKCSKEKIVLNQADINKMMVELKMKKRLIIELEDKLTEMKKTHKTEAENAHNLKIKLDNLKHKQRTTISQVMKGDLITSRVKNVLDNYKLHDEHNILTTSTKRINCFDDFEDANRELELLINSCISLGNKLEKK